MINHWQIWRQKILLFICLLHWILNPHSSPDLANAKFMFHSLPGPWLEPCTFKFSVHPAFWEGKRGLEKGIDVVKIQPLYLLQKTAEGIEGGAGRGFSKPSPLHRTKPGLPGGRNYAGAGPPPPPREIPPARSGRWDRHGAWGPPGPEIGSVRPLHINCLNCVTERRALPAVWRPNKVRTVHWPHRHALWDIVYCVCIF